MFTIRIRNLVSTRFSFDKHQRSDATESSHMKCLLAPHCASENMYVLYERWSGSTEIDLWVASCFARFAQGAIQPDTPTC